MAHVTPHSPPLELDVRPGTKPKPAASQPEPGNAFDDHLEDVVEAARRDRKSTASGPAGGTHSSARSPGPQEEAAAGTGPAPDQSETADDLPPVRSDVAAGKKDDGERDPVFKPASQSKTVPKTANAPVIKTAGETVAARPPSKDPTPVPSALPKSPEPPSVTDGKPVATEPSPTTPVIEPSPQAEAVPASDDPAGEDSAEAPLAAAAPHTDGQTTSNAPIPPIVPAADGDDPAAPDHTVVNQPGTPSIEVISETEPETTVPASGPPVDPGAVIDDIAGTPIAPPSPTSGATVTTQAAAPAQQVNPAQPAPAAPDGQKGQPTAPDIPAQAVQDRPAAVIAPKPQAPQNVQPQQAAPATQAATATQAAPATQPAPPQQAVSAKQAAPAQQSAPAQPTAPAPDAAPSVQQSAQPVPAGSQGQTATASEPANVAGVRPDPTAPAATAGTERPATPVLPASAAPKPAAGLLNTNVSPNPEGGSAPVNASAPTAEQAESKPTLKTALDVTGNPKGSQTPAKAAPAPTAPPATVPLDPALPQAAAPASDPATPTLPLAQNSHTVSIRFGASPLPGSTPQMPVNTLAFNIARNVENGVNRFEIRIDPPELGRVDVKLDMTVEGRVQAHLTVERSETLELMMRDARSLEKALADTGLNMNRDSLSFSLKDQNASGGGQNADGTGPDLNDTAETPGEEEQSGGTAQGYITEGGVDISV